MVNVDCGWGSDATFGVRADEVESADLLQRGEIDLVYRAPGLAGIGACGLLQCLERLGPGVVVVVADESS
jgi:hypothetical protein